MKPLSLDERSGAWLADLAVWGRESSEDNEEQLERLRRNLRLAREQALTPRQRQMLTLYYDHGLTMGQIALKLSVNQSTVSRTLTRAKRRLYRCLRYSF
ncbi:MAG: sigma-70 family RNA polymerase sigma factor [Oscillibacter sp.]|nr:sigma-70 family RNA polymerase sigma factor [Oscillibacter sp.]